MPKKFSVYAGLKDRTGSLERAALLTSLVDVAVDGSREMDLSALLEAATMRDPNEVISHLSALQNSGWLRIAPSERFEDDTYHYDIEPSSPKGGEFRGLEICRVVIEVRPRYKAPPKQQKLPLDEEPRVTSVMISSGGRSVTLGPKSGQGEPLPRDLDTGAVSTNSERRTTNDESSELMNEDVLNLVVGGMQAAGLEVDVSFGVPEVQESFTGEQLLWVQWLSSQIATGALDEEPDGSFICRLRSIGYDLFQDHWKKTSCPVGDVTVSVLANDMIGLAGPSAF